MRFLLLLFLTFRFFVIGIGIQSSLQSNPNETATRASFVPPPSLTSSPLRTAHTIPPESSQTRNSVEIFLYAWWLLLLLLSWSEAITMSYNTSRDVGDTNSTSTAGMFSYPSSPLFEQPFTNRDFYAEQTPLRSRSGMAVGGGMGGGGGENDAFVFSPTNPYFTTPQRRKRSFFHQQFSPDLWVKQVMRFVLLSPLIVLLLWSVGAVLFTSSSTSASLNGRQMAQQSFGNHPRQQQKAAAALLVKRHSQQRQQQRERPKRGATASLPTQKQQAGEPVTTIQTPSKSLKAKELIQDGLVEVVELSGDLFGQEQPSQLVGQPQASLEEEAEGSTEEVSQPRLQLKGRSHLVPPVIGPLVSTKQSEVVGGPATRFVHSVEESVDQYWHANQAKHSANNHAGSPRKRLHPLPSSQNNLIVQPQHLMGESFPSPPQLRGSKHNNNHQQSQKQKKNIVYYYYDPQSTMVGPEGQIYLPNVVFDHAGKALDTRLINRGGATQVFIQPPPLYGATSSTSSNNSGATSAAADVEPQEDIATSPNLAMAMQNPPKGISFPTIKEDLNQAVQRAGVSYQENGSSVIVATVAVMALLVGALSARKLRGRTSILGACIENERLDHMNAVDDTATEATNTAYSTFHWKGDLEKFDV